MARQDKELKLGPGTAFDTARLKELPQENETGKPILRPSRSRMLRPKSSTLVWSSRKRTALSWPRCKLAHPFGQRHGDDACQRQAGTDCHRSSGSGLRRTLTDSRRLAGVPVPGRESDP